jgi:hypothetical protein
VTLFFPYEDLAGQALRMAAQSIGQIQTVLGMIYRRIRNPLGGKGAVTAPDLSRSSSWGADPKKTGFLRGKKS